MIGDLADRVRDMARRLRAGAAAPSADGRATPGQIAVLVERQIARRGVRDRHVLAAMRTVPREVFVDPGMEEFAYEDGALPIGEGQTISQPYIVALMIEAAEVRPGHRVLEIGAGSGYAAAVLSRIAESVHAIERHDGLTKKARARLDRIGYDNVTLRAGDGTRGWAEAAPFDGIIVTAAAAGGIPPPLLEQLKPGRRMVIPVGGGFALQHLVLVDKAPDGKVRTRQTLPVAFVPLVRGG